MTTDWPRPAYAWYVVALLVLSYAFGVVDRIVIGLLVQPIKAELGLSDTEIGLVQGLAFALFYSLFTLPVGLLVDRWKRVPVVWLGLATWSVATVACGLARSLPSLFLARVAMGGSIGIGVAYLFGGIAIGLATSVRELAPGLLGGYAQWHIVFFMVGVPGLALAALMALTVREPARRGVPAVGSALSLLPLWRELSTNRRALLAVMVGTIMNVMIVNAQLAWFPTLFVRVHHWSPARIATALALVGTPLGLASALTAGWALTRLQERGHRDGPLLVMMLQCASWAIFGTLKCLAPTPALALAGHAMTSLFATWALTAAFTALNQVTPNPLRGQVVAVYTLFTGLVGVAAGSGAVGLLSDHVFRGPTGIAPSLALVSLAGGLLGITVLLYGRRGFEGAVERARAWGEGR